jgi:hypothetical protein
LKLKELICGSQIEGLKGHGLSRADADISKLGFSR